MNFISIFFCLFSACSLRLLFLILCSPSPGRSSPPPAQQAAGRGGCAAPGTGRGGLQVPSRRLRWAPWVPAPRGPAPQPHAANPQGPEPSVGCAGQPQTSTACWLMCPWGQKYVTDRATRHLTSTTLLAKSVVVEVKENGQRQREGCSGFWLFALQLDHVQQSPCVK